VCDKDDGIPLVQRPLYTYENLTQGHLTVGGNRKMPSSAYKRRRESEKERKQEEKL
jgi:hypothetical protein